MNLNNNFSIKNLLTFLVLVLIEIGTHAQNQSLEWAHSIGGTTGDRGQDITVDQSGNVYTVGAFTGTVDFDFSNNTANISANGTDAFIQKINAQGQFLWVRSISGNGLSWANAVVVDEMSNVYTVGFFRDSINLDPNSGIQTVTSNGLDDFFVQKLDSNGNFQWGYSIGANGHDRAYDIAVDALGNLYVCGVYNGLVDFDPGPGIVNHNGSGFFIQKINSNGQLIWVQTYSGIASGTHTSTITVDSKGNVYCAGSFYGTIDFDPDTALMRNRFAGNSLSPDAFILKLDTAGSYVWVNTMGGTSGSDGARIEGIVVDTNENIFVTGRFEGTVDFNPRTPINNRTSFASTYDLFIQKVDPIGDEVWTHTFGRWGNDYGNDIALDKNGNIYTIGMANSGFDFDPDTSFFNVPMDEDMFIHKLDSAGSFSWVKLMQGSSADYSFGHAIYIDEAGSIYTVGEYNNTSDFDPGTGTLNLTSNGLLDGFVQKLSICNSSSRVDVIQACNSYTWINGVTYTSSNNTAKDTIFTAGCDSVFVSLDLTIDTLNTVVVQNGITLNATVSNTNYQWLDCNNNYTLITGATNQSYTVTMNGSYAVEISKNGCKDTSTCIAVISVGLSQQETVEAEFNIYPNPVQSTLITELVGKINPDEELLIYDLTGRVIIQKQLKSSIERIDLSTFKDGVYLVQYRNQTKKFVLNK